MYKRVIWAILAAGLSASAQSTTGNGVHIYTVPEKLYFQVDGQTYLDAVELLWPANSKHTITSYDQFANGGGTRHVLKAVYTNLSSSSVRDLPITADPALKWVRLEFETAYRLVLPGCCIEVNGVMYHTPTQLWILANDPVHARAFPNAGYIFTGWGFVWQLGTPTQYDITFPMWGPLTLAGSFQQAAAVNTKVNVVTNPSQLQVLLDRTPYVAPVDLEWGWNTTHALGMNPVQEVNGVSYVFDSWSDGGAVNHDFRVPDQSGPIKLTARFVPGTIVTFLTSPPGLTLSIDGRQNWPSYNFVWHPDSTHKISAPATQTDAEGHKYRFVSWSNGKSAAFDYVAGPAPGNDHIIAVYQAIGEATFTSAPAGLTLQVDGANCNTPCTMEKDAGTTVSVSASAMRALGDQARLVFQSWNDSTEGTRAIVMSAGAKTYTATYVTQNRLTLSASPSEGASFAISPNSPDGFYDAGALVSVRAMLAPGYRITTWSGNITGSTAGAAVTLDAPKIATLILDRVPAIGPMGIRNAAPDASPDGVAPGSLISIFGASLAPELVKGPDNLLPQTLAGVTVRVDNMFLPLVFVSPEQISAQLPARLAEGDHTIVVRWEGKPETAAPVSVMRNAPGLLSAFLRPDQSTVTEERPARPGDIVSVLGTGLGPYLVTPPDGFLLDEGPAYSLIDRVTVVLGEDTSLDPLYAGRSKVAVGVDAVRFQLPAELPDLPSVAVRIRINGKESNTVLLPIARAL